MERAKEFLPQRVTFIISNENRKIQDKIKKTENSFTPLDSKHLTGFTYFIENSLSLKILLDSGVKKIEEGEIDKFYTLVPLYISPPKIGLTKERKLERTIGKKDKNSPDGKRGFGRG